MTSSADQTLPRSMPGSASNCGSARWKPVPAGCEPGRQDHLIGAESLDIVVVEQAVLSSTLTCSLRQLPLVPVEKIEDLATARLHAGEAELAAEPRRGLDQRHLVAALGGHPRRLETRDAAADDQHRFGRSRRA